MELAVSLPSCSATVDEGAPQTMFLLFYLELLLSAENKHEVILQKMMLFTSLLWDLKQIVEEHLKTLVLCRNKLDGREIIQLLFEPRKHVITVIICAGGPSSAPDFAFPFQHELILRPSRTLTCYQTRVDLDGSVFWFV